jgi:hypothetical protein
VLPKYLGLLLGEVLGALLGIVRCLAWTAAGRGAERRSAFGEVLGRERVVLFGLGCACWSVTGRGAW